TMLALAESIHSGTTTISDFYMFPSSSYQAISESGLRGNVGISYASKESMRDSEVLKNVETTYDNLVKQKSKNIKVSIAPHAPYTCSIELLKGSSVFAKNSGAVIQIHLHETKKEVSDFVERYEKTPIELLEEMGFLENKVAASHCVWVNESDLKILSDQKVNVVVNPQSNLKLASGFPPINKFIEYGIPVSIGTDGASSNNNLAVLEDMRLASLVAKGISLNPQTVTAGDGLRMATKNGAVALGYDNVGLIKEGYQADLIFIDVRKPNLTPLTNPLSLVAYSMYPRDISSVMVAGKFVMRDGIITTFDEQYVMEKAQDRFERLSKLVNKNTNNTSG
ncbi:MAG: amidohydrolase family protein, partial [Caldisericaceae bacterium]